MNAKQTAPKTVDAYIATFPKEVQTILNKVRMTIRKAAPGVEETISYRIAGFTLNGRYLLYLAAFKGHIGVYPIPKGDAEFNKELVPYRSGKATMKIPLDKPIPLDLIVKFVKFREKENLASAKATAKKKKRK